MKTFLLKLDNEVHKTWDEAAKAKRMTLSEFIRSTVNAQLGSNGNGAAIQDAGRAAGVRTPRRRAGVVGRTYGTSVSFLAKDGTITEPVPAPSAAPPRTPLAHAPTCTCMLCESRRKKLKK